MVITEKRTEKKFKDVGVGMVIRFTDDRTLEGYTYMKTMDCHADNGDYVNLICLDDGTLFYANEEENVEVLRTELIIKR